MIGEWSPLVDASGSGGVPFTSREGFMLRIAEEQTIRFRRDAAAHFEEEMIAHAREFFPNQVRVLGEPRVRTIFQYVVARARGHGLTTKRDICLYFTVALLLGSNFDVDALLPWASELLADTSPRSVATRIDRVADRALEYIEFIAGPDNIHLHRSLLRIRRAFADAAGWPGRFDPDFEIGSSARLMILFPKRAESIGDVGLSGTLQRARELAATFGVDTDFGVTTCTLLVFVLGTAFDTDPQLATLTNALHEDAEAGPDVRAARLNQCSCQLLDRWLGIMQRGGSHVPR